MKFVYAICHPEYPRDLFSAKCLNKAKTFMAFWSGGFRRSGRGFVWYNHFDQCNKSSCEEMKLDYTRWHSGDPNNAGGNQNCIQLWRKSSGFYWVDQQCFAKSCVICEMLP